MQLTHGGDIYSQRNIQANTRIVDFSANINPMGMPESVKKAIIDHIDSFSCYPDPLCRALVDEIAKYENIPAKSIFCGNGAADIIFRLAATAKPKRTLVTAPTFSEYEMAARTVESEIVYHYLHEGDGFNLSQDILDKISPDIDMMFLCNPNNPTGIPIEKGLVLEIAERCKSNGTILVVDECFNDFLEQPEKYSIVDTINDLGNVIILKAFTKIFAMAGIRLGYCICSDRKIIDSLYTCGQPWSVSTVAQKCGIAALQETEYVERTRELVKGNREHLMAALSALGLKVFDSRANYILFKCENRLLYAELEKCGILIRWCGNYTGLDDTFFRIAVRGEEDNVHLIKSLGEILRKC